MLGTLVFRGRRTSRRALLAARARRCRRVRRWSRPRRSRRCPPPATHALRVPRFRRFWPRPAIMRHDPGLAASPPVRYMLKMERCWYSPFSLIVDRGWPTPWPSGGTAQSRTISHDPRAAGKTRVAYSGWVAIAPLSGRRWASTRRFASPSAEHHGNVTESDDLAVRAMRRRNSGEISGGGCQDDGGGSDQPVEGPSRGSRTTRSTR
jgi:hypothetical protein